VTQSRINMTSQPKETTENGLLSLVSLGPGDVQQMTLAAKAAIEQAEVVIGYQVYIDFVQPLLNNRQTIIRSPIGSEVERAEQAIALAAEGRRVALISSGDIGIYAMASPVFELLHQRESKVEVEVYPGVSAIQAVAAKLGAPLGHDFCTISLSDLLTPWGVIERRVEAAAWGDFVIGFYNPRSQKRDWQLQKAIDILMNHRSAETPVALVRNITRADEQVTLTTLAQLEPEQVDMFTLVLVGNSQSFVMEQRIVTPRGYHKAAQGSRGAGVQGKYTGNQDTPLPPSSHAPLRRDIYPLTLTNMKDVKAIVVGGGPVGERKVKGLLDAGATVQLISPEATPQLKAWADEGRIVWAHRAYQSDDLSEADIAFAATNRREINAQIAADAKALGLLRNVADNPAEGNFHVPALYRQPEFVVAVSTTGQNPRRAQAVRNRIRASLEKKEQTE